MATIPRTVPPLPRTDSLDRELPAARAFGWLRAGWEDFKVNPVPSLLYGFTVFIVSIAVVGGQFALGLDYILLPSLAGFMVLGPLLALGLYEKSRRIANDEPVTLTGMILVKPKSGGQVLFTGVLLCLLMVLWMRAAVILYALFFGLRPFPGMDDILPVLLTTPIGWSLLGIGTIVGGLFAAFSFAISVLSIPMLLNERLDALTAMGMSMALVWNNLPVMLTWGGIVLTLFVASVVTGLVGLIVVFPVLGHATWHAYKAIR